MEVEYLDLEVIELPALRKETPEEALEDLQAEASFLVWFNEFQRSGGAEEGNSRSGA